MTLYDYISTLVDKQSVDIECFDRFGEREYSGPALDVPLRLCENLIMKHDVHINMKSYKTTIAIVLA